MMCGSKVFKVLGLSVATPYAPFPLSVSIMIAPKMSQRVASLLFIIKMASNESVSLSINPIHA